MPKSAACILPTLKQVTFSRKLGPFPLKTKALWYALYKPQEKNEVVQMYIQLFHLELSNDSFCSARVVWNI